jgi:hypothetical protein
VNHKDHLTRRQWYRAQLLDSVSWWWPGPFPHLHPFFHNHNHLLYSILDSMSYLSSPSSKSNNSRKESRRRRIQDRGGPCLSPSRHWEVELWRRSQSITSGRSDVSFHSHAVDSRETDLVPQSAISTSSHHSKTSPPSPTLPSSPAAFDLNTPLCRPSILTPRHDDKRPGPSPSRDLDQLRLHALTELQRSVVETGEGFVDKMRDWETHRQQETVTHRGLKRSRSMMTRRASDPSDDSGDVMILDSTPADEAPARGSRKKRALSVDLMGGLDAALSEATPSATADDDTESCSRSSSGALPSLNVPSYTNTSSSSDKAVSALTLAFANGACGINDYQAVLDAYNHTHYGEEGHVGELWD